MTKLNEPDAQGAEPGLFEDLEPASAAQVEAARATVAGKIEQGAARLREPNRKQVELRASDLQSLLAQDHRARLVWGYVEQQGLSRLLAAIKARGSKAGRAAIDPRVLFALWLYATLRRRPVRAGPQPDAHGQARAAAIGPCYGGWREIDLLPGRIGPDMGQNRHIQPQSACRRSALGRRDHPRPCLLAGVQWHASNHSQDGYQFPLSL